MQFLHRFFLADRRFTINSEWTIKIYSANSLFYNILLKYTQALQRNYKKTNRIIESNLITISTIQHLLIKAIKRIPIQQKIHQLYRLLAT